MPDIGRTLLVIIFYFLMMTCSSNNGGKTPLVLQKDSTTVTLRAFAPQVQGYGRLISARSENLIARFSGNIHLQNRSIFAKGQVIYQLHGPDVDLEKNRINGLVADAQARYDFASAVYQRKKTLIEEKVLAPKERDKIIYNYRSAQEDLKQVQAELNYFLQMTDYKAPYDGYLGNVSVNQNAYVKKGQPIAQFQAKSKLKLIGTLYGDSVSFVKQGTTVKLELNATAHTTAKITYLEQTINLQSGGRAFWAEPDSLPQGIKAGDYVHYRLEGNVYQAPAVPSSALVLEKGNYYAVICSKGQYRNAPVLPGQRTHGFTQIKKGLKAGYMVLTTGSFEVFHRNLQKNMKIAD